MSPKIKRATIIFFDEQILMECPLCGRTLIKTDYNKIRKLLNEEENPRGKVCAKCGGVAVLRLNDEAKNIILAKFGETAGTPDNGSPENLEEA